MNADDMPAGQELDAAVAERVMGFRWMTLDVDDCRNLAMLMPSNERLHPRWIETTANKTGRDWCNRVPHYSTNIADAWLVVERLVSLGFAGDVGHDGIWFCTVWKSRREIDIQMTADTAPLAICRAALQAIDAQKAEAA